MSQCPQVRIMELEELVMKAYHEGLTDGRLVSPSLLSRIYPTLTTDGALWIVSDAKKALERK